MDWLDSDWGGVVFCCSPYFLWCFKASFIYFLCTLGHFFGVFLINIFLLYPLKKKKKSQSLLPQKSSSIAWTWLMSPISRWEIPQPIVPGGVISYVSCLLRGEWIFTKVEIVVVCGSYLSEKTYGEKGANAGVKLHSGICHLGLYFFCCGANNRLGGFRGIFGISFLRVSINTLFYVTLILT